MELEEKPASHLDVLSSELGIKPELLKTQPQILTHFNLGNTSYNRVAYDILDYIRKNGEITHVKIKIKPYGDTGRVKYQKISDKFAEVPDDKQSQVIMVPIDQFNQMLTRGMDQMGAAGSGGAANMLPGG